ncbi:transposase [Pricia sp. S334]|uniref:Transposase n=1 Tax=Pricia mediterranea TaxID=3076079 RepID=A0ABU3L3K6_9FLAO|nr:transposase [Pricia sp. S334]MDT7828262.1 transposase [Pricia sp. S334]
MENIEDLYTDYLLSSFGQVTSTGLSSLLDGSISHDKITRHLSGGASGGKELWLSVKPFVKKYRTEDACIIFDDTIVEKPYSKVEGHNCYHFDHSKGINVKGINMLNCLYHSESEKGTVRCPVNYHLVAKLLHYCEISTKKEKRKATVTKNELFRDMVGQVVHNQLPFRYVLADSWFCSNDNMKFIHKKGKRFIFEIKANRLACRDGTERDNGRWKGIRETVAGDAPVEVYLKGLGIRVLLVRQVFTNKDGSTGERFLVSNDLGLDGAGFMAVYKKRWSVEEYHKGIKQNASAGRSPANSLKTRANHIFHSILAYVKLEKLRLANGTNHFAKRAKVYLAAVKAAYRELNRIKGIKVDYEPA